MPFVRVYTTSPFFYTSLLTLQSTLLIKPDFSLLDASPDRI